MQGRLSPPVPGRLQSFSVVGLGSGIPPRERLRIRRDRVALRRTPRHGESAVEPVRPGEHAPAGRGCGHSAALGMRRLLHGPSVLPRIRRRARAQRRSSRDAHRPRRQRRHPDHPRAGPRELRDSHCAGERRIARCAAPTARCIADAEGVSIALETELPAGAYCALVEEAGHPALGIYYDAGNAAAKGYDLAADVRAIAPWLRGVHVKDRKRGGGSVPLGQGDADFPRVLRSADGRRLRWSGHASGGFGQRLPGPCARLCPLREGAPAAGHRAQPMRALVAGLGGIGQRHVRNLRALLGADVQIDAYRVRKQSPVLTERFEVGARRGSGSDLRPALVRRARGRARAAADRWSSSATRAACTWRWPWPRRVPGATCSSKSRSPRSWAGVDALADLVDQRKLVALVGYQMRFHPCLRQLRDVAAAAARRPRAGGQRRDRGVSARMAPL